jgi:hypothetical protein
VSSGGRYGDLFVLNPTIDHLKEDSVMKRFLGVLIASMFLASVAYAASDMKKEEGKGAKDGTAVESTTKGEKGEKTKGEKSAKTADEKAVKSKGEKDEKIKGEKTTDEKKTK